MASILILYHFKNGTQDAEVREVSSLSDLDVLIREETKESVVFADDMGRIEFFVRYSDPAGRQKFILSKEVEL